jgi:putative zinc finger/helix-turn-helix YgiT family protein
MNEVNPRQRLPNVCPRCGAGEARVAHLSEDVSFKGLTLEVHGLAYTVCQSCAFRWATDGQQADNLARIRDAYATKRDEIRFADGLLSGDQIGFVLQQLGLSKSEAAQLFGGGPNAFSKYMAGDVLQSKAMDRLLRVVYRFGGDAIELLRAANINPALIYTAIPSQSSQVTVNYALDPVSNSNVYLAPWVTGLTEAPVYYQ